MLEPEIVEKDEEEEGIPERWIQRFIYLLTAPAIFQHRPLKAYGATSVFDV